MGVISEARCPTCGRQSVVGSSQWMRALAAIEHVDKALRMLDADVHLRIENEFDGRLKRITIAMTVDDDESRNEA
jgi:hypothetical protein